MQRSPLFNKEFVAQVAYEVNKAYCESLGDFSFSSWSEAPDWQKNTLYVGVEFHRANPDAGAKASHESWFAQKVADGWKYGPVKDADKKEHPCMVPFHELPKEQQAKDYIFRAIVHALS